MREKHGLSVADWRKLAASRELELKVVSESMYPTLKVGDIVKVMPLIGNPKRGVVTVFFRGDEYPPLVVHRCVGAMSFRGDNRLYNDPPVLENQLVGIVEEFVRDDERMKVCYKTHLSVRILFKRFYLTTRAFLSAIKRWVERR